MKRRLLVTGRVQGVWYRGWTVGQARALGLSGWVRNRGDGSVEVLAEGSEEALAELAERCRRGPASARVGDVQVMETDDEVPVGFGQRPTL